MGLLAPTACRDTCEYAGALPGPPAAELVLLSASKSIGCARHARREARQLAAISRSSIARILPFAELRGGGRARGRGSCSPSRRTNRARASEAPRDFARR